MDELKKFIDNHREEFEERNIRAISIRDREE